MENTICKIVIMGNCKVGKTSLLRQYSYTYNGHRLSWNNNYNATIGTVFFVKKLKLNNQKVQLVIWDTSGNNKFHSISLPLYKNSDIIIIMYDITYSSSFLDIPYWLENIKRNSSNEPIIALIGNKIDSLNRVISFEEGQEFADDNGLYFDEVTVFK